MKTLLDAQQIKDALTGMADRIVADLPDGVSVAVIGIRSRGEVLGQRLAELLSQRLGQEVPCGVLDITLYRDDLNCPQLGPHPQVRTTDIPFEVDDRVLILVDDVLFTGRSARSALDALIDLGRPRAIRLAVLVDRYGREFPIQADYAGHRTTVGADKRVYVHLVESDGKDEVVVD